MKKIVLLFLLPFLMPVEAKSADATHLGQKIQDHVMLVAVDVPFEEEPCTSPSFVAKDFFRVRPDGTRSPNPFRVPVGKSLVITDVEWTVQNDFSIPGAVDATAIIDLLIRLRNAGIPALSPVILRSQIITTTRRDSGDVGKSESLTTGFVVATGALICPEAHSVRCPPLGSGVCIGNPEEIETVILRGYLVKAEFVLVPTN